MTAAEQYAASVDAVNAQRTASMDSSSRTIGGVARRRNATAMTHIAASTPTWRSSRPMCNGRTC